MGVLKFDLPQAKAVINRFNLEMEENELRALEEIPGNLGPSGYAADLESAVNNITALCESIGYDERVTAQALEEVENEYESELNKIRLFVIHYREDVETDLSAEREENITDITVSLSEKADDIIRRLQIEEEDEERRRQEEERRREEREKKRQEQENLEAEYNKIRSNLQRQIARRRKAGVEMPDVNVPDIPKRITRGSINRLNRMISYIQDEYRYLGPGRGYRGSRR